MGRSYSSQASAQPPVDLDGVVFTPAGSIDLLSLSELAGSADLDVNSPRGAAAIAALFEQLLGEAEYARFRGHVKTHRTAPHVLIQILMDAVEDASGFPTKRPSDLPDGPSSTPPTLTVVSSSRGVVEQEPLTAERSAELQAAVADAELAEAG